jgi:DNA mismatch endonuclease (patch repair protein)
VTDRLSREDRSKLMGRVRHSGTSAEVAVRRLAHGLGFRFRLGRRDLPGSPDIVFPRHRAVVFVHGCFWHHHKGCRRATIPLTNREFWVAKFDANTRRDADVLAKLHELGWRTLVVWECEVPDPVLLEQRLLRFLSGRPLGA